ncbi:hypothetical protein RZS08_34100, partial [Arthrospira platensis SPKY1]|nr:hypothetical protein [Arthrospira platensis SPKY1]
MIAAAAEAVEATPVSVAASAAELPVPASEPVTVEDAVLASAVELAPAPVRVEPALSEAGSESISSPEADAGAVDATEPAGAIAQAAATSSAPVVATEQVAEQ